MLRDKALTRRGPAVAGSARRLVVAVMVVGVTALLAPEAFAAAPPIPGSPLDAYREHVPYDMGVHKIARLAAIIAYVLMVATVVLGVMATAVHATRRQQSYVLRRSHDAGSLSDDLRGHPRPDVPLPADLADRVGPADAALSRRRPARTGGHGYPGTELAIAVACSVWLQNRLGYHRWLRIHQFAYASFALIWLHIFLVHPEPRHLNLVAVGIAAGAGTVLVAFLIRLFPSRSRLRQRALPSGAGATR